MAPRCFLCVLTPAERDELARAGGAVLAVGDDGSVAYASPAARALLGWDASLVGQPLDAIIPDRLQRRHHEGFARYVRTGESRLQGHPVRVPARRRDGTETELDLTIRVFRRPDGTKLVAAEVSPAAGRPPAGLQALETALMRRAYELI